MMTKTQVLGWNPATLTDIGSDWLDVGAKIEALFDRYVDAVTKIDDSYWEGLAAEAAQSRARSDRATALLLVDALDAVAVRAKQGFYEVDPPLQRARLAIDGAEAQGFTVTEDLLVWELASLDEARIDACAEWNRTLVEAARDAESADKVVRDDLAAARENLRILFTSAATLGGEQGLSDAAALVGHPGALTSEQLRRLVEAGRLTLEQLDAVALGGAATIPASQMEYLQQLVRAFDGKTPQEVASIFQSLPPEAQRALANSLQIVSNENVSVSVGGDPDVPARGGLELLPDGIRESLTRDDLVVERTENAYGSDGPGHTVIELHGVADNQAIADIVAAGGDEYKAGTELDRQLLGVGQQYLAAQVAHEQNPEGIWNTVTVDGTWRDLHSTPITESIFAAVGDDKSVVRDAVTDEASGQGFVRDVLSHNWTDDGTAAASMFAFGDLDATVEDPSNAHDVAVANRTGNIMSAVGEGVSSDESWNLLRDIPGTDGQSVGSLNPDLLGAVANGMTPYIDRLAVPYLSSVDGFETAGWADPDGVGELSGSAHVVALMNTDEAVGKQFGAAILEAQDGAQKEFALDPTQSNGNLVLERIGSLAGLHDQGVLLSTQDSYDDQAQAAQVAYERKSASFDLFHSLAASTIDFAPGGGYANNAVDSVSDSLKESLIGAAPGEGQTAAREPLDYGLQNYAILDEVPGLASSVSIDDRVLFNENGELEPYEEIQLRGDHKLMVNVLDSLMDGSGNDLHEIRFAYDRVTGTG